MARTVSDIVIDATEPKIMETVCDFEKYPAWATGMTVSEIVARDDEGRAKDLRFVLDSPPIRDTFVLRYDYSDPHRLTWSLVSDQAVILQAMDGVYALDAITPNQTRVTYQLYVDLKIPILGMLKRKAEKVIVDTALKGLESYVEAGA